MSDRLQTQLVPADDSSESGSTPDARPMMLRLPPELLVDELCAYLSPREVFRLGVTCRALRDVLLESEPLWRRWCMALEANPQQSTSEKTDVDFVSFKERFRRKHAPIFSCSQMQVCWLGHPHRYWTVQEERQDSAFGQVLKLHYVWWVDIVKNVRLLRGNYRCLIRMSHEQRYVQNLEWMKDITYELQVYPRNVNVAVDEHNDHQSAPSSLTRLQFTHMEYPQTSDWYHLILPGTFHIPEDGAEVVFRMHDHKSHVTKSGVELDYVTFQRVDSGEKMSSQLSEQAAQVPLTEHRVEQELRRLPRS